MVDLGSRIRKIEEFLWILVVAREIFTFFMDLGSRSKKGKWILVVVVKKKINTNRAKMPKSRSKKFENSEKIP